MDDIEEYPTAWARKGRLKQHHLHRFYSQLCAQYPNDRQKAEKKYVRYLQRLVATICLTSERTDLISRNLAVIFNHHPNIFHARRQSVNKSVWLWKHPETQGSVFHAVAASGHLHTLTTLLESAKRVIKADHLVDIINHRDSHGKSPSDYALENRHTDILAFLAENGSHPSSPVDVLNPEPAQTGIKRKQHDTLEEPPRKLHKTKGLFRRYTLFGFDQTDQAYSDPDSDEECSQQRMGSCFMPNENSAGVVLFRGITFLQTNYDSDKKRALKTEDRTCRDYLSHAAAAAPAGNRIMDPVAAIRQRFIRMPANTRDALLNLYISDCAAYEALQAREFGNPENPFFSDTTRPELELISFDLSAETACGYAMGTLAGSSVGVQNRQYPNYDAAGKPHHRSAGVILAAIIPTSKWDDDILYSVRRLWAESRIRPGYFLSRGNEVIVAGGIRAESLILQQPLLMPDFSRAWQPKYLRHYGLTQNQFDKFKNRFRLTENDGQEPIRRQLIEEDILKHLRRHYARLIEKDIHTCLQNFRLTRLFPGLQSGDFCAVAPSLEEAGSLRRQHDKNTADPSGLVEPADACDNDGMFRKAVSHLRNNELTESFNLLQILATGMDGQHYQSAYARVGTLINPNTASAPALPDGIAVDHHVHLRESAPKIRRIISGHFIQYQFQAVIDLARTLIMDPEFPGLIQRQLSLTTISDAKKISIFFVTLDRIMVDYISSLSLVHFSDPVCGVSDGLNLLPAAREMSGTLSLYINIRSSLTDWLSHLDCTKYIHRTLRVTAQCRLRLKMYEDAKRISQINACLEVVFTYLHNLMVDITDNIYAINGISAVELDQLLLLLTEFNQSMMLNLTHNPGRKKEFLEWTAPLGMANSMTDYMESQSAEGLTEEQRNAVLRIISHIDETAPETPNPSVGLRR